jgi:hypothetical protein
MLAAAAVVGEAAAVVVARVPAGAAVPRWRVLRLRPGTLLRSAEAERRDRILVRRGPRPVPSERGDPGQAQVRQALDRTDPGQASLPERDPAPDN